MGYGSYSYDAHEALLRDRSERGPQDVFHQRTCHPLMNPKGVKVRESRDSADHPNSTGVVFALDVTGSMGAIPKLLATKQLPKFMKILTDVGVPDPQLLFMAVGDATSDAAPLQVGQFESTAELMDQWLTWTYLEGAGGEWGRESYELGLYFLAQHTEMDCHVKRGRRGYLFMTGDEKPYERLSRHVVDTVIGDRLDEDLRIEEIVAALQKSYVPFFVIPDEKRRGFCERTWRDLLGDNVLTLDDPQDVCFVTAGAVALSEGVVKDLDALAPLFTHAGIAKSRIGPSIRALRPFAEVLGKAGPLPPPSADEPGGLRKLFRDLVGK